MSEGGQVLDVRPVADFAAGHVSGAVSIPLRDQFATWLGWVGPDGVPLGFVLAGGQDPAEVAWQALKIGYENLAGQLDGGMAAWHADAGPAETTGLVTADRSAAARCWKSGRPPSTPPATFPAQSTSSSAACPPAPRTRLPGRW